MSGTGDDFDGAWLFAQECQFVAGADRATAIPPLGLTEVAFAGRSNVGKSSLLNALTGRNHLARVSHTPGRTQQINFFNLGNKLWLVDLPGHGYAEVSKAQRKSFSAVTQSYIRNRATLRRVQLLVDSRHGYKESDEHLMDLMDSFGLSYQIVMTKADKAKLAETEEMRNKLAVKLMKRPACHPEILITSAHDRIGLEALRDSLAEIAKGQ
ncbi:MAG TPA: ribosome biogenesis GTP-binding protein YihA/YsxC [Terriglobales bacterium]|jgi:GTP-binding protein|nr:ribosome biogenesis GTP-binding protein YihA/YsxC [Terriglobales bacterium]